MSADEPRREGSHEWTGLRRHLGVAAAVVSLVLATAGAVLPLLPSTPFALLAAYLLMRCSPAWHRRLLQSRLFGGLLRDWQERRGIRLRDKLKAIGIVIVCGSVSILATQPTWTVLTAIVALLAVGITVIVWLPTARKD